MSAHRLHVDIERRLPGLDLRIAFDAEAGVLVLFGPSGAGKTTALDAIAGLVEPDAGEVVLDGTTLFRRGRAGPPVRRPARERRIGYVLQNHALFPHLTVAGNVGYALWRRPDADARVAGLLERVGIAPLARRMPRELSGGQQQRVAIARALAMDSRVLLLDEPFDALDGPVRERLQRDLRALQRELDLIVLCVTHRIEDAFAVGDRVAVLIDGRIVQSGAIEDVFRRPVTPDVAELLGLRNLFRGRIVDVGGEPRLDWDGLVLRGPFDAATPGDAVTAYIRPEDVKIVYPDRPLAGAIRDNLVDARVLESRRDAALRTLRAALPNGHTLEARFSASSYLPLSLEVDGPVRLALRRDAIVVMDRHAGAMRPPAH
jgi:molybdate transport system ATP-binding protein